MLAAEPSFMLNGLRVTSMMQLHKKDGKTINSSHYAVSLQSINFLITSGLAMEAQANTALVC